MQFPDIDPVFFRIGWFEVRWYALAYVVGILLGGWYSRIILLRMISIGRGIMTMLPEMMEGLMSSIILGVILGGRIGYVLFYNPVYYWHHPLEVLMIWNGGMSFHGGMLGVVVALIVFGRLKRVRVTSLADLITPSVPIGLFFGRIANFINGELFGRPTEIPWGIVFPGGGAVARHPSQLYQAFMEGVVLFFIMRVCTHETRMLEHPGITSGIFLVAYGVLRAIGETFREPDAHLGFLWGPMTMGMALSFPMILVGFFLIYWAYSGKTL